MKSYTITGKTYVAINIPIDSENSIIVPKKGRTLTLQFNEIPIGLKTLEKNGIISIKEN